jgi:protein AroM
MQKKPRVGMISIGQSPRPDILSVFGKVWGKQVEMVEIGALDGFTHKDVQMMAPKEGDDVLVVRMADGRQHIVGHDSLTPQIQACADILASQNLNAAILLCTGHFQPFHFPVPFIIPQKIVDNTVASLVEAGHSIGVMIPAEDQQGQMRRNFAKNGIDPVFASASPHLGEQGIIEAASQLKQDGIRLIVMHCFGYTPHMRRIVKEVTGKPVLLSTQLVAKVTSELLL